MIKVLADNALLTYSLKTTPSPVQASDKDGQVSTATLQFVISCPLSIGQLTVKLLTFNLPIGDPSAPDASDLSETAAGISCSVVSSGPDTWYSGPGVASGSFLIKPGGSGVIAEQSLTVTFTGIVVSPIVGNAEIEIVEESDAPSQPRRCVVAVPKFPAGFSVSNFKPDKPQVDAGGSVTLTWDGSADAVYTMHVGSDKFGVTDVRAWPSPALYVTTIFWLEVSATVSGQTVTLDLYATVTVAAPDVLNFWAVPDQIDYNQWVTLHWRSDDADGVYLFSGQFSKETLPATDDPANPKMIQPQYTVAYTLQAFKRGAGSQEKLSKAVPLAFAFNALEIDFSAVPTTLDQTNKAALVSWDVRHAKSVAYQGQTGDAKGSQSVSPADNTTYQLAATWVDGQVTTKTVDVKILKVNVTGYAVDAPLVISRGLGPVLVLIGGLFTVEHTSGGQLLNVKVISTSGATTTIGSVPCKPGTDPNTYGFGFMMMLPDFSALDHVQCDYTFEGYQPVSQQNVTMAIPQAAAT